MCNEPSPATHCNEGSRGAPAVNEVAAPPDATFHTKIGASSLSRSPDLLSAAPSMDASRWPPSFTARANRWLSRTSTCDVKWLVREKLKMNAIST